MGFLDELKKLTRPYDEEEFEDEFEEGAADTVRPATPAEKAGMTGRTNPFAQSSYTGGEYSAPAPANTGTASARGGKVVSIGNAAQTQVVLVKPERFETAADIADHLREKRTVVMNLEQTQKDVARRLIDFLSGVAYAQDGKIKKVANSTYIITPVSVDLLGDQLEELENAGLYF